MSTQRLDSDIIMMGRQKQYTSERDFNYGVKYTKNELPDYKCGKEGEYHDKQQQTQRDGRISEPIVT